MLPQLLQGLEEEISNLSHLHPSRLIPVSSVQWQRASGEFHMYNLRLGETLREAPDTAIELWVQGERFNGFLIFCRGQTAQIAFRTYLGDKMAHVHLQVHGNHLLQKLRERLTMLPSHFHLSFAESLFESVFDHRSSHQKQGLANLLDPTDLETVLAGGQRLFIWGPAGTGKTQALAEIAALLVTRGERVFLTGNTHLSVTNALERTLHLLGESFPTHRALRYTLNHFFKADLFTSASRGVDPDLWVRDRYPDLFARKIALSLAHKSAKDQWLEWKRNGRLENAEAKDLLRQLSEIERDLQDLHEQWREKLRAGINQVDLLGSTLAQVYLTDAMLEHPFDTVIVDEASMALLPALYLVAGLARKRIILIGDFCQLPPIALGRSERSAKWLGRDIFAATQVDEWILSGQGPHPEILILRHQRRMHPHISSIANEIFYAGMLVDDVPSRDSDTVGFQAVTLYDTSCAKSWCTRRAKGEGKSRVNLYHAWLSVQLAERFLLQGGAGKRVGVMTPYREQAKLIEALVEDRSLQEHVDVATVHQFQGEERDAIIWDTTDAAGLPIGLLLEGNRQTTAARLMNVALTRARHHLFILADCEYLQKHLSSGSCLRSVLDKVTRDFGRLPAESLFPPVRQSTTILLEDLQQVKGCVICSVPLLFQEMTDDFQKCFQDLESRGISLYIDTLHPKIQREVLRDTYRGPPGWIKSNAVVTVVHDFPEWRNFLHANVILLDEKICWFGSENPFSKAQRGHPYRVTGRQSIREVSSFFGLSLLQEVPRLTLFCPLCEGFMVLMWNRRRYGSAPEIFATCSEGCGYHRPLLRGEHGRETRTEMTPQPSQSPHHPKQKVLPGFAAPAPVDLHALEKGRKADPLDPCPQCRRPTVLRYQPDRYLFIGCSTYPRCDYKRAYEDVCPLCEGPLVVRRSQHGIFLGCIQFPRCRATKPIAPIVENLRRSA